MLWLTSSAGETFFPQEPPVVPDVAKEPGGAVQGEKQDYQGYREELSTKRDTKQGISSRCQQQVMGKGGQLSESQPASRR